MTSVNLQDDRKVSYIVNGQERIVDLDDPKTWPVSIMYTVGMHSDMFARLQQGQTIERIVFGLLAPGQRVGIDIAELNASIDEEVDSENADGNSPIGALFDPGAFAIVKSARALNAENPKDLADVVRLLGEGTTSQSAQETILGLRNHGSIMCIVTLEASLELRQGIKSEPRKLVF